MRLELLVEGLLDEAVARKLLAATGHEAGTAYGKKGWAYVREKCDAFRRAQFQCLALVDLMDTGIECAAKVPQKWLSGTSPSFLLRVVVREIESWLLADRTAFAEYLGVSVKHIPVDPDTIKDPKQALINVARHGRRRKRASGIVPAKGVSVSEGPLYSSELTKFVTELWDAERAALNSDSLRRCVKRLTELPK